MAKLLTVVGATGAQGLAVIDAVLGAGTPYKLRGTTRDPSSEKAKALEARGIEVVKADVNDEKSLVAAFEGSVAIFGMTNFFDSFGSTPAQELIDIEATQGINIAKAAAKTATLEHFVWSSLPNSSRISGGKYLVPHFDGKARVDDYILKDEKLRSKTTTMWITWYANNFQFPILTPAFMKTAGTYIQALSVKPDTLVKTLGDPANIGTFVLAILKKPEVTLPGRFVIASHEDTTVAGLLDDWSAVTGKTAKYLRTDEESFVKLWGVWGEEFAVMYHFWEEVGDKSWSGPGVFVDTKDLGIPDGALLSTRHTLTKMNEAGAFA